MQSNQNLEGLYKDMDKIYAASSVVVSAGLCVGRGLPLTGWMFPLLETVLCKPKRWLHPGVKIPVDEQFVFVQARLTETTTFKICHSYVLSPMSTLNSSKSPPSPHLHASMCP